MNYSQLRKLKQENAQLKEQLENAIVPKFKHLDAVWIVCDMVVRNRTIVDIMYDFNNNILRYRVEGDWYLADELFYTKAEAQKELERSMYGTKIHI